MSIIEDSLQFKINPSDEGIVLSSRDGRLVKAGEIPCACECDECTGKAPQSKIHS